MIAELTQAVNTITSVDEELRHLRSIAEWARRSLGLGYDTGDRVVIVSHEPAHVGGGWSKYREALAKGATAIAGEIRFNEHRGIWQVAVMLDREWSVSDWNGRTVRYWRGPVADTPDGYEPPSKYDQENHPDGKRHWFHLAASEVRSAGDPR